MMASKMEMTPLTWSARSVSSYNFLGKDEEDDARWP